MITFFKDLKFPMKKFKVEDHNDDELEVFSLNSGRTTDFLLLADELEVQEAVPQMPSSRDRIDDTEDEKLEDTKNKKRQKVYDYAIDEIENSDNTLTLELSNRIRAFVMFIEMSYYAIIKDVSLILSNHSKQKNERRHLVWMSALTHYATWIRYYLQHFKYSKESRRQMYRLLITYMILFLNVSQSQSVDYPLSVSRISNCVSIGTQNKCTATVNAHFKTNLVNLWKDNLILQGFNNSKILTFGVDKNYRQLHNNKIYSFPNYKYFTQCFCYCNNGAWDPANADNVLPHLSGAIVEKIYQKETRSAGGCLFGAWGDMCRISIVNNINEFDVYQVVDTKPMITLNINYNGIDTKMNYVDQAISTNVGGLKINLLSVGNLEYRSLPDYIVSYANDPKNIKGVMGSFINGLNEFSENKMPAVQYFSFDYHVGSLINKFDILRQTSCTGVGPISGFSFNYTDTQVLDWYNNLDNLKTWLPSYFTNTGLMQQSQIQVSNVMSNNLIGGLVDFFTIGTNNIYNYDPICLVGHLATWSWYVGIKSSVNSLCYNASYAVTLGICTSLGEFVDYAIPNTIQLSLLNVDYTTTYYNYGPCCVESSEPKCIYDVEGNLIKRLQSVNYKGMLVEIDFLEFMSVENLVLNDNVFYQVNSSILVEISVSGELEGVFFNTTGDPDISKTIISYNVDTKNLRIEGTNSGSQGKVLLSSSDPFLLQNQYVIVSTGQFVVNVVLNKVLSEQDTKNIMISLCTNFKCLEIGNINYKYDKVRIGTSNYWFGDLWNALKQVVFFGTANIFDDLFYYVFLVLFLIVWKIVVFLLGLAGYYSTKLVKNSIGQTNLILYYLMLILEKFFQIVYIVAFWEIYLVIFLLTKFKNYKTYREGKKKINTNFNNEIYSKDVHQSDKTKKSKGNGSKLPVWGSDEEYQLRVLRHKKDAENTRIEQEVFEAVSPDRFNDVKVDLEFNPVKSNPKSILPFFSKEKEP